MRMMRKGKVKVKIEIDEIDMIFEVTMYEERTGIDMAKVIPARA